MYTQKTNINDNLNCYSYRNRIIWKLLKEEQRRTKNIKKDHGNENSFHGRDLQQFTFESNPRLICS